MSGVQITPCAFIGPSPIDLATSRIPITLPSLKTESEYAKQKKKVEPYNSSGSENYQYLANKCLHILFFPFLRIKNKPEQTFGFAFVPVKIENVYGIVLQERNLHQSSVDYVQ